MATHTIPGHFTSVRLFMLLWSKELRTFDFVNLHKFLPTFWHRVPSVSSHTKPFVETLKLFVLLHDVFNISFGKLGGLRNLSLLLT